MASRHEITGIPNIVLIGVPTQKHLDRVRLKLDNAGLSYCAWEEPDLNMGLTALATVPLSVEEKQVLARYRLWQYCPVAQLAEQPARRKPGGCVHVRTVPGQPTFNGPVVQSEEQRTLTS